MTEIPEDLNSEEEGNPLLLLDDVIRNNLTGSDYYSQEESDEELASELGSIPDSPPMVPILDVVSSAKLKDMTVLDTRFDPDLPENNILGKKGQDAEALWTLTQAERLKASGAQSFTNFEAFRKKVRYQRRLDDLS